MRVTHAGGPFNIPAGVAVAPSGEVFVADGYANCRVHRFSAEGEHLASWGAPGEGAGHFNLPPRDIGGPARQAAGGGSGE